MEYKVELLDPINESKDLVIVVRKHAEAPREWGMDYEPNELELAQFTTMATADNSKIMVIRQDGEIAAFIWFTFGKTRIDLVSLWTEPEHRRHGLAQKLKQAVEEWGRKEGKKILTTTVFATNKKMVNLNEKLGYKIVSYNMEKEL